MTDYRNRSQEIKDGVAVVTGAGSGLGRALSLELARRGMRVVGLGRRADPLKEMASLAPEQIFPLSVDVGDPGAVAEAFIHIQDQFGMPTVLINNAAVYPHRDILDETSQSFMETVVINLGGPLNCCLAALPAMVENGFGRIINVGSFADINPAPVSAAYSVSKGAARILTRAFVSELGIRFPGIIFNDWMPGILATGMGPSDGLKPETAAVWGANLALWYDRDLNGLIFDRNIEVPPPSSLKRRLFNRMTGRKVHLHRLDGEHSPNGNK